MPCDSFTPRSISSTRVRTWHVFCALVMTKASTTPKSSAMPSTTVSRPSLASADSAAVVTAGGSWTCTSTPGVNAATPRSPRCRRRSAARMEPEATAQRRRERRATICSARRSARRCAWAGSAADAGTSDSSVHPAGMALIQGTAYRARRRMQRMTGSGTMPSTGRPSARQLTDLRAGDGHLGPVDPFGPPPRGNGRRGAGRPGDDGQGDEAPEVLGAVPGAELGDQVGPDHQVQLRRGAARLRQDLLGGVHRVAGAAPLDLEPAGLGPRDLPRQGLGQRVAVRRRGHRPLPRLLPRVVGHDEQQAVEARAAR